MPLFFLSQELSFNMDDEEVHIYQQKHIAEKVSSTCSSNCYLNGRAGPL